MTQGRVDRSRVLPRAHTVCVRRIRMSLVRSEQADTREYTTSIPRTWGECQERALGTASNPCAYLRCTHNLLLDVSDDTGSYKVTWPHLTSGHYGDEYEQLPRHTCALRVAEQGGMTLDEIGEIMNLTRERVRQIETKALLRLRDLDALVRAVDDELDGALEAQGWRRIRGTAVCPTCVAKRPVEPRTPRQRYAVDPSPARQALAQYARHARGDARQWARTLLAEWSGEKIDT